MWRTMSGLQSNLCYCSWMWRRSLSHLALLPTSLHVLDCNQHQCPVWEGQWLNIHTVKVRCTQNPNSKTALKPTPVSIWKIVPNPLPVYTLLNPVLIGVGWAGPHLNSAHCHPHHWLNTPESLKTDVEPNCETKCYGPTLTQPICPRTNGTP